MSAHGHACGFRDVWEKDGVRRVTSSGWFVEPLLLCPGVFLVKLLARKRCYEEVVRVTV